MSSVAYLTETLQSPLLSVCLAYIIILLLLVVNSSYTCLLLQPAAPAVFL